MPISTYNGFYAKSDREYTKGMRKNRYFDEIVRSGMPDPMGVFEKRAEGTGGQSQIFVCRAYQSVLTPEYIHEARCIDV